MAALRLLVWLRALRAYSYTCPLTPVMISAAVAHRSGYALDYGHVALLALAVVLLFAGANMVNEYYDFKKGVDTAESLGSSKVLVEGLLTPRQVAAACLIIYAAAVCIGLYFVLLRGPVLFWLLLIGVAGGYLYTGGPAAFKYIALGEPLVFCLMGPLVFTAIFYALTGTFSLPNLLVSVPVGLLITAILTGNNLRDLREDTASKITTLATLFGFRFAVALFTALIGLAYGLVAVYIQTGVFSAWMFLVFLTIPGAVLLTVPLWRRGLPRVSPLIVQRTFVLQLAYSTVLFGALLLES